MPVDIEDGRWLDLAIINIGEAVCHIGNLRQRGKTIESNGYAEAALALTRAISALQGQLYKAVIR